MANIIVGVFKNNSKAQDVIRDLLVSGFSHDQIGVFSPRASDPHIDQTVESLGDELKQEAGMDDLFRSLASMFTDYDELTVYSDATRQGQVVLSVRADDEGSISRAVELMERHSPLDLSEELPRTGGPTPWGSVYAAALPEGFARTDQEEIGRAHITKRVGRLRIYSSMPSGPGGGRATASG